MEMHTNRVAPSSIPGRILFRVASVFNCKATGRVGRWSESPSEGKTLCNFPLFYFILTRGSRNSQMTAASITQTFLRALSSMHKRKRAVGCD